eukprot:TRINITY_DN16939_c0_g1_i1.p2 TRINITY_DN16939_c0_g1~~TRINITY_DN16939_c0_g1_i1.p2  ORF type:complete len:134 (+),score=38.35 TRINITY_DN16939_c0_g1_i1:20-421(+)
MSQLRPIASQMTPALLAACFVPAFTVFGLLALNTSLLAVGVIPLAYLVLIATREIGSAVGPIALTLLPYDEKDVAAFVGTLDLQALSDPSATHVLCVALGMVIITGLARVVQSWSKLEETYARAHRQRGSRWL